MKKTYCLLSCVLCFYGLSAQVFFTESFETIGDYTAGNAGDCSCVIATTDANDGQNDHFADLTDDDITHNFTADYTGEDGSRYWASEDNDDGGVGGTGNPTQCVTLSIDITGKGDLLFSGLFGGHGASTPTPYEADNDMEVSYQIDGGGFIKILDWHENAAQTGISLDTDFDGFGDGTFPLSSIMQTVTALIPGTGTTLEIQICTNSNTSSEEFAFDNLQLAEVVLPVDLVYFEAMPTRDNDIVLEWKTAGEINNKGFNIEYSIDGVDWHSIDFVKGKGNINTENQYHYQDNDVQSTDNYYRLKQVDYDGRFEYSKIRHVKLRSDNPAITVMPNPSDGNILLLLNNPRKEQSIIRVMDNNGGLIWMKSFNQGETNYFKKDINLLQSGMYYIIYNIGDEIQTEKISVLR